MDDTDKDVEAVQDLEARRYNDMTTGDFDDFAALCHPDLIYTHSSGSTDTLDSYLDKCRSGYYVYHQVDHPVSKVVIRGDTALVLGEMNATVTAGGTDKELRNTSLSVWVRDDDTWKLAAYQPTPRA
jgi:uncharacterized protein (TIGR02246 family)